VGDVVGEGTAVSVGSGMEVGKVVSVGIDVAGTRAHDEAKIITSNMANLKIK
jgi:hypothetical protein